MTVKYSDNAGKSLANCFGLLVTFFNLILFFYKTDKYIHKLTRGIIR